MIRNALILVLASTLLASPLLAAVAADRVYVLDFDKLNCGLCRKAIKEKLEGLRGVKSVEYDLKEYRCIVTMNGDSTLTAATVTDLFKNTKYVFRSISERRR